jgi:hypothetical protein
MSDETLSAPTSFFRFVVVWHSGSKKHQLGVLRFAGRVLEWQKTTYDDERVLRDLVRWFNQNLTAPARLDKVAAIFWFKPQVAGETELWGKLIELVRLLLKYRYRVEVVTTKRPGKIVYDDATQIAAVPFNDTFGASHIVTDNKARAAEGCREE